jgi:hypothetical protein
MSAESKDEDALAAYALGEILTSALMRAYNENRSWLYCWERDGLQWLVRYQGRKCSGSVGNLWMHDFIQLNHDAILSENGKMDFNLKAFDERRAVSN